MIPYKSRAGRAIRNFLGGTIGACAAFLLIVRAEAGEEAAKQPQAAVDLTKACAGRDGWADPAPPAHVFGNVWYVGTCGITVALITSDQGHILIDGGPADAAPLVAANIEKLGFKLHDLKWIVSSHEHDDHVGALAELKRLTGAQVAAVEAGEMGLETGRAIPTDPQRASVHDFAPVQVDRSLADGDVLELGELRLTGHATPAHAPGSASWTWRSCDKGDCRTIAYADSTSIISADGYRFRDHADRVKAARRGLARIAALPCDILITPHPQAANLFARLAGQAPLEDADACRRHAESGERQLTERLAKEAETAK